MRSASSLLILSAVTGTLAFPWAAPDYNDGLFERGTSGQDYLKGLLGTVATNVSEADRRPDPGHPFIAPGPTDQRGPCPGLNLLANHGYIPRNGITTAAQAGNASIHVFNMGPDVANYLNTLQIAFTGNIETETYSIGGEDIRTYSKSGVGSIKAGRQYGADAHFRVEVNNSPTRANFYENNGDAHTGDGARFRRFVEIAKANGGQFNATAIWQLFKENVDRFSTTDSLEAPPTGTFLSNGLAAYTFIAYMYGNGTYGYGGTNNYESVSSLLGFKINSKGQFCYVPERIPEQGWFRFSAPFTTTSVPGVAMNIAPLYGANPFLGPSSTYGQLLADPTKVPEKLCAQFQALIAGVPSTMQGTGANQARAQAAIDYMKAKLYDGLNLGIECPITIPAWNDTSAVDVPALSPALQTKGSKQRYNVCK